MYSSEPRMVTVHLHSTAAPFTQTFLLVDSGYFEFVTWLAWSIVWADLMWV